ncbi:MAG: hypothetical protein EHM23_06145 [Acidobacteria bacterium]|nr:MAG: hypothetical protein EHM23_06145 [Acidobacteriota bacterium]
MQRKVLSEVDKLTRVAEKLFLLHQKGVRFGVNQAGRLAVEYIGSYRCSRHEEVFLATQAERILFLLPYWRVKLFHSLMTPEDIDFLNVCNINLELPEDSELRSPVTLPSFEERQKSEVRSQESE